jgi:hypothetical protein
MCGQIRAAEPSEKTSIGGADPRRRSRAERIRIMEIKIEKGAILSQYPSDPNKELSFFNSAIESGAIKSSVFAFKLASKDSEYSELFLGGTNPSLYTGDFETHDATTSTGNYFPVCPWRFLIILFVGFWQITGASTIVGGNITLSGFDTMLVSALHCDLC